VFDRPDRRRLDVRPAERDPGSRAARVLRADCERCVGLCCVASAFSASADFAIDKAAGQPCPNLQADFRCGIHAGLADLGFRGCVAYDCFGAGQRVSQETLAGADWRADPEIASGMFAAFSVVRQLHELLWYLTEALGLAATKPLHRELRAAREETDVLAGGDVAALGALDVAAHRLHMNVLLRSASALARAGSPGPALDRRGADLVGADLRAVDLRGSDLRGAVLIRADLRGVDLALADLTGADLRDADLRGADLQDALFLTQSQLDSARGDRRTGPPPSLSHPADRA
jgi:uncharacterized protein YjbI with pentapeptide repeats